MWSNSEKNIRGFCTPPASWRSPHSPALAPMSERKMVSPSCRRDIFHVVHKVPAGDSPYVRAKHVQLIDKDPSKAISLFWAAINAGDRVDSALKDMAVVMKQLDRSDEAIEAIKSFRHLCPYESQESIDNVLVELYKRSGRIEEEIEMLQRKLKEIEEGIAFGGKRTKIARSQGKKIQITVDQEKSRILGNLAWAYLQHHDYGSAEQHYKKALSLEPDKNKQCNLAICLMHMNRIPEAKSLLQTVKASSQGKQMDDSYAKSYERAFEMLIELASRQEQNSTRKFSSAGTDQGPAENGTLPSPAPVLYTQPRKCIGGFSNGGKKTVGWGDNTVERATDYRLAHAVKNLSGELSDSTDEAAWRKTQSSLPSTDRDWRRGSWRDASKGIYDAVPESFSKLAENGHRITNTSGDEKDYSSQNRSWKRNAQENDPPFPPFPKNIIVRRVVQQDQKSDDAFVASGNMVLTDAAVDNYLGKNCSTKSFHKSWADMAEEEEELEILARKDLSLSFGRWNSGEESNDENIDSNINIQNSSSEFQFESISTKLEAIDIKDGNGTSKNAVLSRNPMARRSLSFEAGTNTTEKKRTRLQVFRDITPSPDSP